HAAPAPRPGRLSFWPRAGGPRGLRRGGLRAAGPLDRWDRPDARAMPPAATTAALIAPYEALRREFLVYIRVECGLSPNTLAAYGRDLTVLLQDLQGRGIREIGRVEPRDLSQHLAGLKTESGLAATSIIRHMATIKVFFRWLLARGFIKENPADILERPTRWKRLPGVLSPRDLKRLIETPRPEEPAEGAGARDSHARRRAAAAPPLWLRDRAMLELMYASGLRASEVGDLGVADLHETLGVVRVTGKGRKQRLVPVGKPALAAIGRYLAECRPALVRPDGRDKGRLLLSRTGRPLERVAVWQIVKRHAAVAGL